MAANSAPVGPVKPWNLWMLVPQDGKEASSQESVSSWVLQMSWYFMIFPQLDLIWSNEAGICGVLQGSEKSEVLMTQMLSKAADHVLPSFKLVNVRYSKYKKKKRLCPLIPPSLLSRCHLSPCYFSYTNARRTQQIISCSWKAPMLCRVLHDFYRHSRCCMGTLDPELRVFGLPSLSPCILGKHCTFPLPVMWCGRTLAHCSVTSNLLSRFTLLLFTLRGAQALFNHRSVDFTRADFLARYVPS